MLQLGRRVRYSLCNSMLQQPEALDEIGSYGAEDTSSRSNQEMKIALVTVFALVTLVAVRIIRSAIEYEADAESDSVAPLLGVVTPPTDT